MKSLVKFTRKVLKNNKAKDSVVVKFTTFDSSQLSVMYHALLCYSGWIEQHPEGFIYPQLETDAVNSMITVWEKQSGMTEENSRKSKTSII